MKRCHIYLRDEVTYLFCQSETVFGIWIGCEPMCKLSRDTTSRSLGETVLNTLQFSQTKIPHPNNLQNVTEGFLNFTGFKSWRAFSKKAFSISVVFNEVDVEITPETLDKRGNFEPLSDQAVKCIPQAEEVGKLILNFYAKLKHKNNNEK